MTHQLMTMGVEIGGTEGTRLRSEKVRRGRPTRFENEVAQIRCLSDFKGILGEVGHTFDDSSTPLKNPWGCS